MNLLLGFVIVLCIVCSQNLIGTTTVAKFADDAVSSSYGLQTGDKIKAIDGMRVYTPTDVNTGFSRSSDGNVEMIVTRNEEDVTLNISFDMEDYEGHQYIKMDFWLLGKEKPLRVFCQVRQVILFHMQEWCSFPFMIYL